MFHSSIKKSLFTEVIILDFSMLKKSGDFSNPYLEVQDTVGKWIVTRVIIPISGLYVP